MKRPRSALCIALLFLAVSTVAQDSSSIPPERIGLERLTEYLNLKPTDISFRSDYSDQDSFRLKIVADLMHSPLGMIDYSAGLRKAYAKNQPEVMSALLFQDLAGETQRIRGHAFNPDGPAMARKYSLYYTSYQLNRLLTIAATYLDLIIPRSTELSLRRLTASQRLFLINEFRTLLISHEEDELLSVSASDSLEKAQDLYCDTFAQLGAKIDKDPVLSAGIGCLTELMPEIRILIRHIDTAKGGATAVVKSSGYLPAGTSTDSYLGKQPRWAVGGPGNDTYIGDYEFILDVGGDDSYTLSSDTLHPHGTIIIDLDGNDHYVGHTDFTLGSGAMSVGLLLDFKGDDRYDAKSFGLGSGFFGFGLLYDARGNDRYDGDTHVEGAGTFGLGLLLDEGGRDLYNAAAYAQGMGFVGGLGALYDISGNDSYYAGGKYKDILRYEDRYLSMSQGFGFGMRPTLSGGIGALIDLSGNDNYYADIFAQGASDWWSLGILYDSSGNDNYQAYQYAQGCGTHMSLGALIDDQGADVYQGKGLMHGCGHDYSCGLLLDRHGADTYVANDLSQGAGSANGTGLLIDNEGDDRYFIKNPKNTQGYGNPRRDYGSIGLFLDLGGIDQYNGNGRDSSFWQSDSKWGGGLDIELKPRDSAKKGR